MAEPRSAFDQGIFGWEGRAYRSKGRMVYGLPWLALPYDSVVHLLGVELGVAVQTLPLTALLAIPFLLLVPRSTSYPLGPIERRLLLVVCVAACVLIVNLAIEALVPVDGDTDRRVYSATRQGVSLFLGVASFLMFRRTLLEIGEAACVRWALIGTVPVLLMAYLQAASGVDRVQGFSTEPSHFADFVAWVAVPFAYALALSSLAAGAVLVASAGAVLLTFSFTGWVKAAFVIVMMVYISGRVRLALALMIVALSASALGLVVVQDSYVSNILNAILDGYTATGEMTTGSLIDRFFGLAGPVGAALSVHGVVGYGLGGDTVYFAQMFGVHVADAIREVKGGEVSVSSLQGKMLLYLGWFGYAIYIGLWVAAWRLLPVGHAGRGVLIPLFAGTLFSLGPLHLPYVWLWFAIAANRRLSGPLADSCSHGKHLATSHQLTGLRLR